MPQKSDGCGSGKQDGQGGMCTHCNKPKPPPELLAQILSLQNNRTAQMMQGMDSQQPFMMGNPMLNAANDPITRPNNCWNPMMGNTNFQPSTQSNPITNQNTANRNPGYDNNQTESNAYGMMNRGNAMPNSGNFDMSQFGQMSAANPMMTGQAPNNMAAGYNGQNYPMNDMQRMGGNFGYPGYNMNMGQNNMSGGYGGHEGSQGAQPNNPQPQSLTPEQMQQMMQFQRMQGGWNQNNMGPNGNQG